MVEQVIRTSEFRGQALKVVRLRARRKLNYYSFAYDFARANPRKS